MVLPIGEALTIPCLTSRMNPAARKKLKEQYRVAKRYVIKVLIWAFERIFDSIPEKWA